MNILEKLNYYLNKPLFLALSGNFAMVVARIVFTKDIYYGFLLWNLFLAAVPLFITRYILLKNSYPPIITYALLAVWLLFLPNAPYIITDLVHLYHRPPVPLWYDMLLLLLSAINGLIMGYISLEHVEKLLRERFQFRKLGGIKLGLFLVMSYGVYMGRYLRFNSWDAILNPLGMLREVLGSIRLETVAFTLTFTFVNYALYKFYQAILLHRSQGVS